MPRPSARLAKGGVANSPLSLDEPGFHPYLGGAMLKKLLTILALIAGIAASSTSAEARLAASGQMRVEATQLELAATEAERGQPGLVATYGQGAGHARQSAAPVPLLDTQTPAIRLKADRARE